LDSGRSCVVVTKIHELELFSRELFFDSCHHDALICCALISLFLALLFLFLLLLLLALLEGAGRRQLIRLLALHINKARKQERDETHT
jgi:hypothetical protein